MKVETNFPFIKAKHDDSEVGSTMSHGSIQLLFADLDGPGLVDYSSKTRPGVFWNAADHQPSLLS